MFKINYLYNFHQQNPLEHLNLSRVGQISIYAEIAIIFTSMIQVLAYWPDTIPVVLFLYLNLAMVVMESAVVMINAMTMVIVVWILAFYNAVSEEYHSVIY